jgi:hypothetical protein
MAGSDGPMSRLGVSHPRQWSATDWAADVVPHLTYGIVTKRVIRTMYGD